ncbi:MAG: hypothetical protein K8I30_10335, partial [Anaerolineae bacterium]|nr:hypothetical protein [Anaerolineae bacterium]
MKIPSALWIGLSILVGAFLGAAVLYWFAGLNALAIILGALAGAALFGVIAWQQRRAARHGHRRRARSLRNGLIFSPLLLVLLFAGYTIYALYAAGQLAVPTDSYTANFDRLWSAIRDTYPYFEVKNVDWTAVRDQYRPQVEAVLSDADYHALIGDMLAELNDGHTDIAQPFPASNGRFGTLMPIGDLAVIDTLGTTGQAAGLARGDVVLAINGQEIDAAIAALPPRLRSSSTPWNARAWALQNLLTLWGDAESLNLTVQDADGAERTVTLTVPQQTAAPQNSRDEPIITDYTLPSGLGVIRIPQFYGGQTLVSQFDAALNALMSAPAIILDLR